MNKTLIGLLFLLAGVVYGSLIFEAIYQKTIGYFIENQWVSENFIKKAEKSTPLGRKATVLLYSLSFIIIGLFILWNRNS